MNAKIILYTISFSLLISFHLNAQSNLEIIKNQALQKFNSGNYGETIDLLNKYIAANPQEAEGYNLRGLSYEKRGQYELSVYDFRSAKKLEPDNPDIRRNLQRVTGNWYTLLYNKIEGHKREIVLSPSKAVNYLEIGKSYKNLGEWLESEKWYDQYLKLEEASSDEILRYTEILSKNNHISKGEPYLKSYVEKYPDDHRLWSRYGYFTYWLGKRKTAIEAFETALRLRPYFKEAQDGLDLVLGKGYVYTLNDTSSSPAKYFGRTPSSGREYPIDRYYRILKRNPNDAATRYLLIEELLKVNRIEEAVNEVAILERTESGKSEFEKIREKVNEKRINFYSEQIKNYEEKVEENPNDRDAVFGLGRYYAFLQQYEKGMKIFSDYLLADPSDAEAKYQYSLHASWNRDFSKAKEMIEELLTDHPDSIKYQLLYGQLAVSLNEDLDKADEVLKRILLYDPKNIQALITLGTLNFQQRNYADAKYYTGLASNINPVNPDVERLNYMLAIQDKREEETAIYQILESARDAVFKGECVKAINLYKEYLIKATPSTSVLRGLADAYVCAGQYENAIAIYDSILINDYSYELDKLKAQTYFWSGDSINALREFQRLVQKNPGDTEAKLFLGDSYFKVGQYENARNIYENLLISSPESHIFRQRLNWLPGGTGVFDSGTFPLYTMLAPEGNYFRDNEGFTYYLNGLSLELGIFNFLSIGGSYFRGNFSSDTLSRNFSIARGNIFLRFGKIISASASVGKAFYQNSVDRNEFQASLTAAVENRYSVTASFNAMDAARIVYSPSLVDLRIRAKMIQLQGNYSAKSGLRLRGNYSYILLADSNNANSLMLRLGKEFEKDFTAGYEYTHLTFDTVSSFYYSPKNYETHSIWADWNIINEKEIRFSLGGRVGAISSSNFILRELYGEISYTPILNFTLQGRLTGGNLGRDDSAYNFVNAYLQLYWSF